MFSKPYDFNKNLLEKLSYQNWIQIKHSDRLTINKTVIKFFNYQHMSGDSKQFDFQ